MKNFKNKWNLYICWRILCINLQAKRDNSNNQAQESNDESCNNEIPISPFSLDVYSKTTFTDSHPTRWSYVKAIFMCLYAIVFFKKRKDIILIRKISSIE